MVSLSACRLNILYTWDLIEAFDTSHNLYKCQTILMLGYQKIINEHQILRAIYHIARFCKTPAMQMSIAREVRTPAT